jgi:hypothetical protein
MKIGEEMYPWTEVDEDVLPLPGRIVIWGAQVEHKVAKDLCGETEKRPNSTLLQEPSQCRRRWQTLRPFGFC